MVRAGISALARLLLVILAAGRGSQMISPSSASIAGLVARNLLIRQTRDVTCGQAAAASLINLLRCALCMNDLLQHATDESSLRFKNTPILSELDVIRLMGHAGRASVADCLLALSAAGLSAQAYQLAPADALAFLRKESVPALAHIGMPLGHFVLILAVQNDAVHLFDPASGLVSLAAAKAADMLSGVVVVPAMSSVRDRAMAHELGRLTAGLAIHAEYDALKHAPTRPMQG
ncbi:MAG: cysteine peptidase family C39 domain-containing protein [Spirochaetaceae bacterium]|nr:cysteine peptidase family C39 domain-containing protein [Spirochaetaceae bacterium]